MGQARQGPLSLRDWDIGSQDSQHPQEEEEGMVTDGSHVLPKGCSMVPRHGPKRLRMLRPTRHFNTAITSLSIVLIALIKTNIFIFPIINNLFVYGTLYF